MRPRRILRASAVRRRIWFAQLHRKTRLLGARGAVQRRQARLDGWGWRVSKRRRNLYRMHHAGLSGQIHAVHEPAARFTAFFRSGDDLRAGDSCLTSLHASIPEQGAALAQPRARVKSQGKATRVEKSGIYILIFA